ncbi:hypothetical protein M5M_05465 [Simiduia agarivorans SA1 = DSM 21679]|uniref:Uncharacterized protein n=2 Tax=Simiduia TaxID=447467 RepID=K4KJV6_SIMAS|nr:hypothetical protein M5M_05465 [Simiduia agarivorans SA1 = DSM 21679]
MRRRAHTKNGLIASGFILLAAAAGASEQLLLANVLERQFQYNIGMSQPGTLAVGQVHYRLEVLDHWGEQGASRVVQVLADGNCVNLLQEQHRYLVTMTDRVAQFREQPVHFIACEATPESEAGEAIAALNAERDQRPL